MAAIQLPPRNSNERFLMTCPHCHAEIPELLIGQHLAGMRKVKAGGHNGGRPKVPTECEQCRRGWPGAKEARACCPKKRIPKEKP